MATTRAGGGKARVSGVQDTGGGVGRQRESTTRRLLRGAVIPVVGAKPGV